jgi:hypothetical protein
MSSPRWIAAALALMVAPLGCGHTGTPLPTDAIALAGADARLHGAWKLAGFRPERPLDPMIRAFVEFQYNTLVVRFEGGRLLAQSPGVNVDRSYRITEADGNRFKMTSFDPQGVPYDAVCTFVQPDTLEVSSWTEPWRGVATLQRMGPWENGLGPLPGAR